MSPSDQASKYQRIIERIFLDRFKTGDTQVEFKREDIEATAKQLGIDTPKNLGDVVYSVRHRTGIPRSVQDLAPPHQRWVLRSVGRSKYRFEASSAPAEFVPREGLAETKIPDATPGVIAMYALSDEQALLAKLRYNRLVDIFTGVTCYSLQSHLRTSVKDMGQIETDEVYIGLDRRGAHFVFPVQAKGGRDKLGVVQIEQDFAMCAEKFPDLICRPIAAQFISEDLIALFELELSEGAVMIAVEKHYRLVPPDDVTAEDLTSYRERAE